MNNITSKQKAKAEQFVKNNIGPKSYKSNAYGELQMLYDFVKDNDLSKMNDEELKSFYIEISNLKNRLIDWVKTTPQKEYQFKNIIFRIKFLYEFINELLTPELLKEANNERRELNDAFDFELKPIGNDKKDIVDPNAESRILKAINEVESKAEKTSNKSSIKDKPKKSGRKAAEVKKLSDYIVRKNWNPEKKNLFIEDLKAEFKEDILSELENKVYPTIKVLIFELIRKYTKEPKSKQITKIEIYKSVWKEFVNDDKISISFQNNTNEYLKKPPGQILSSSEYKKLETRIRKIFKTKTEYFA
jgi:hypothetical protein